MRRACLFVLLVMTACAGLPAMAAGQGTAAAQTMTDLDRNMALGAALDMRDGTEAELGELRALAERGVKQARAAIAANPDSADAQYALGSWLLYGYRVVEVDQISFDAQGNAETERVTRSLQGMGDDPEEGLAALNRASELAPANGQYLLDYAATLIDYDRADQAEGILKGTWAGQPDLPVALKMRAAILLSGIAEANDDLDGAREWIYSALSLDPIAAPAVDRLRELDEAALEAALAPSLAEAEEEAGQQPETVEGTPSAPEESAGMEEGGQPSEEEPSAEAETGSTAGEQAPDQGAEAGYEQPPDESYQHPPDQGYQEPPVPETGGAEESQPETGY
jgi:hypothetical protein